MFLLQVKGGKQGKRKQREAGPGQEPGLGFLSQGLPDSRGPLPPELLWELPLALPDGLPSQGEQNVSERMIPESGAGTREPLIFCRGWKISIIKS